MNIGRKIEKLLENSNMTQRELAERINLDETILSRIISGERSPKVDVVANIATVLRVTSDYLLDIENSDDYDPTKEIRILARNASKLTKEQKKELLDIILND